MDQSTRERLAHERAALRFVVAGIFLNYLGYGAVLPFEVIYLHEGRGFSLGVAGLAVGLVTGVAVVAVPLAGPLIDRFGARTVAAVAGVGNGALLPAQSTLVATLAPPRERHRATAASRVAANLGAGIGGGIGGLVAAFGLPGFVVLFLANGLSYLVYVCVLVAVVSRDARPEPVAGGYRRVVRDRAFVHLGLVNVAMIAIGWGVFTWLVPPFAGGLGINAQLIGLLLLANAATVTVAQVPIARLAEGRRRVVTMAVAAWLFTGACLLVVAADMRPGLAYPALVTAVIVVGLGECCHTTVLMPLAADLAPAGLRGRYMAAAGLSWWTGLALAPVLGTQLLSASPVAAFLTAAGVALAAGISALTLERRLPAAARRTPRPT